MQPEPWRLSLTRPPRRPSIALTPLIDVVFILLLFFMLASNLQREPTLGLQLAAPVLAPSPGSSAAKDFIARVEVESTGVLRLNGIRITKQALVAELAARRDIDPKLRVLLVPAPDTSLQQLVAVLETLAGAGISGVTLQ